MYKSLLAAIGRKNINPIVSYGTFFFLGSFKLLTTPSHLDNIICLNR